MTDGKLKDVLDSHKKWLSDEKGGVRADLHRADLRDANLRDANLSGANLSGADLGCANLIGADLGCADLGCADLSGANLSGANLIDANLSGADLRGADLFGANLSGANLSGAYLFGADLGGADLGGADLFGANLYNVKGVTMFCEKPYTIVLFEDFISFGCKTKTIEEWESLTEEDAFALDSEVGVTFWKSNRFKEILTLARKLKRAAHRTNAHYNYTQPKPNTKPPKRKDF